MNTGKRILAVGTAFVAAVLSLFVWRDPQDAPRPHAAEAQAVFAVNGVPALAARRYNEAVYATTHNAMSSHGAGFILPNQISGLRRQLEDGVRAVMLDVHEFQGRAMLCHTYCELGGFSLVDGLVEIREFLDSHPNEVVTIILESYVSPETLATAFADSGILRYAHAQTPGAPWPLLGDMVSNNRRLVVFTDRRTGGVPWLHNVWQFAWDTHWNVTSLDEFNCDCSRGDASAGLMILNHFISNPFPTPMNAERANAESILLDRALACWRASGRLPNFITVDYYEIGDVLSVVDRLNGMAAAPESGIKEDEPSAALS